jgi:hypothetical protein
LTSFFVSLDRKKGILFLISLLRPTFLQSYPEAARFGSFFAGKEVSDQSHKLGKSWLAPGIPRKGPVWSSKDRDRYGYIETSRELQVQLQMASSTVLFYFTFSLGESGSSFSLPMAISAALLPDNSIDPNVGPMRGRPCVSVTDIPLAIRPGKTSSV